MNEASAYRPGECFGGIPDEKNICIQFDTPVTYFPNIRFVAIETGSRGQIDICEQSFGQFIIQIGIETDTSVEKCRFQTDIGLFGFLPGQIRITEPDHISSCPVFIGFGIEIPVSGKCLIGTEIL